MEEVKEKQTGLGIENAPNASIYNHTFGVGTGREGTASERAEEDMGV